MTLRSLPLRRNRKMRFILLIIFVTIIRFHALLYVTLITAALPITWLSSSGFYILQEQDAFDVTFANYSVDQQSTQPEYFDRVPPVLHQISLGGGAPKDEWLDARNNCLQHHAGWDTHLWTDENANEFVADKFPNLKELWEGYRYAIQRVDALRYMVLYEYGGPLRRFGFVAPAAHPVGFSNGMMLASKNHPFVEDLVRNLPRFNINWFGLPYPTVMFSTGCHYASVIHTLQKNRSDIRILTGPKESPYMHRLNGDVVTPLFHHFGASSWHSFDAALIVSLGNIDKKWIRVVGFVIFICALGAAVSAGMRSFRLNAHSASPCRELCIPDAASRANGLENSFKTA